ncbi:MAG: hypothetical protein AseanaTS_08460 [Candidatus Pelagadaptatus aseana]|uniref:hypothetical protein n=1 Tax=Candidatus Pelagadaptatus aseana TaxID=3120508 RepID=UPI0039B2F81A
MMTFLATLVFCLVAVTLLMITQKSRRRVTVGSSIRLLEWMLLGQADENDWEVFCTLPILHDETLNKVRLRCAEIAELYPRATSRSIYLLTDEGLDKLKPLLEELRQYQRQRQKQQ